MPTIPAIEIRDPASGRPAVRNALTIAFFLDQYVHEASTIIQQVFDEFMTLVPQTIMKWVVPNANAEEWREVTPNLLRRCRDSIAAPGSQKRSLTAFEISDTGAEPPNYRFLLNGRDVKEASDEEATLIEMTLPLSFIDEHVVESLISQVTSWAERLQPCTGYVAPGLLPGDANLGVAYGLLRGVALRYPGYDVSVNEMTAVALGGRLRAVQWITILSPKCICELGGLAQLNSNLPVEAQAAAVGAGALIRSSKSPEIGDRNRGVRVVALKPIADALKQVTLFDDPDMLSYFASFDEDLLRNWERRFIDS